MIHGKVSSTPVPAFLAGGGEMGALMRAHDWSATPLGPFEAWPQTLRLALGLCLNAQHPIGIYWGEQRRLLYNDAWRRLIGEKHPAALGAPAGAVYAEIDANDFTFQIEDDWTNGRMPSLSGRRRLDEFGPERIIALRAGRALAFENRPAEPAMAHAGIVPIAVPIRAGLTVPLDRGGRFAAALFAHCREPRRWTDDDMELAREAAEATWSAVERARAETALEETEARLRALTDNLPLGIIFQIATGRDGSERRFLYVSENHERLTGIPAAAVRAD